MSTRTNPAAWGSSLLLLVRLLMRFIIHCVVAGVSTARIIVARRKPARGTIRLSFAPMSETGAALLGAMVSLTPGSTVIDIDLARREMLLHLLDIANAEANLALIRRDFEGDIARLCPPKQP